MSKLESKTMFECVESEFVFHPCLRQGSVEAPRLWQKMATQIEAYVEEGWMKKRVGILMYFEDGRAQQICSAMWGRHVLDYVALKKKESGAGQCTLLHSAFVVAFAIPLCAVKFPFTYNSVSGFFSPSSSLVPSSISTSVQLFLSWLVS